MPRDPLRVHRLIDPQHIGPAGGSFLQSRLGGVVDGLAQQRQRLRLPGGRRSRQQAGLVIPPLTQAPGADTGTQVTVSNAPRSAPPRTRRSALRGAAAEDIPELEAGGALSGRALVPTRGAAQRKPPGPGAGRRLLRPGSSRDRCHRCPVCPNTAAEGHWLGR